MAKLEKQHTRNRVMASVPQSYLSIGDTALASYVTVDALRAGVEKVSAVFENGKMVPLPDAVPQVTDLAYFQNVGARLQSELCKAASLMSPYANEVMAKYQHKPEYMGGFKPIIEEMNNISAMQQVFGARVAQLESDVSNKAKQAEEAAYAAAKQRHGLGGNEGLPKLKDSGRQIT